MTLMVMARRAARALRLFLRGDIGYRCRLHICRIMVEIFHEGEAGQNKNQKNFHKPADPVAGIVEQLFNLRMT